MVDDWYVTLGTLTDTTIFANYELNAVVLVVLRKPCQAEVTIKWS